MNGFPMVTGNRVTQPRGSLRRTGWGKGPVAHSPPPWGIKEGILQIKYFIPIFLPNREMQGEKIIHLK